jgi:hypothetical protein
VLGAVVLACQASPPPATAVEAHRLRANLDTGLDLYAAGDFVLAAHRFAEAAHAARRFGSVPMERKATAAECTAWLRARRLGEFSHCTQRLEGVHRRERRSDPGLNALLALGAVAGQRPPPPVRVPASVHALLRAPEQE